ncbi:nucleotidyltransferase, partial [Trifolium pratense]
MAIANACKVPSNAIPELSESDVSDECEKQFNEDQELEQLINRQICFKIYPFRSGIVK